LMVDFNQGLTLGDALHRCHALDDEGLYWFEEPTTYDNLAGYAQLARELDTPVQLGENFYGPRELFRALAMGAGDYVMLDLMRIGGVSGWLRAVSIAGAAGIEVSTHLYPEVAAHLMRVTETAHWLEWQDWADPVLAEPFKLHGDTDRPDGSPVGVMHLDDHLVVRHLRIGQRRLHRIHRSAQDVHGLERVDHLLRGPLAELLAPPGLQLAAVGDLRLVGRVARIGREVLDAQAPADHLERIRLEGSHHDDVTVERREGAGEGEGAPVQALDEIQPGGGFLA